MQLERCAARACWVRPRRASKGSDGSARRQAKGALIAVGSPPVRRELGVSWQGNMGRDLPSRQACTVPQAKGMTEQGRAMFFVTYIQAFTRIVTVRRAQHI